MELISDPIAIQTGLFMVKDRLIEMDYIPEDHAGPIYPGRMRYPNIMIKDLGEPLGIKINEISIGRFTLHGIIPVYYDSKNDITECIIDYFTIN